MATLLAKINYISVLGNIFWLKMEQRFPRHEFTDTQCSSIGMLFYNYVGYYIEIKHSPGAYETWKTIFIAHATSHPE